MCGRLSLALLLLLLSDYVCVVIVLRVWKAKSILTLL